LENALGLEQTRDEPWRPLSLLLRGFLGSLTGLAAAAAIRFFRPAASRRSVLVVSILLGLAGMCLGVFVSGRFIPPGRSSGVLRETAARRIPDSGGEAAAFFREGQNVLVRPGGGPWVWVEAPDTPVRAGWTLREDVVFY
jgi:hypothetical protein